MQQYGLQQGCEWWAAGIDILPYALVVDWVLSDSALAAWDNNGQQVQLNFRFLLDSTSSVLPSLFVCIYFHAVRYMSMKSCCPVRSVSRLHRHTVAISLLH